MNLLEKNITNQFPQIKVCPVLGDFNHDSILEKVSFVEQGHRKVLFFPGSTIGNLEKKEALNYLKKLMNVFTTKEYNPSIFLGVDIVKEVISVIENAYNDKKGVTNKFNKNLLVRMNRELNSDFDVEKFEHVSFFNREQSRIEMHLRSLVDQVVLLGNKEFFLKREETIHTENSYKYDIEELCDELKAMSLRLEKVWFDDNKLFAFCYITSSNE